MDWGNTLLIVTSDHGNSYMRLNDQKTLGVGDLPEQLAGSPITYPGGEVTYRTGSHTNELVRLYSVGSGSHLFKRFERNWYFYSPLIDNTHIFHVMASAAGAPQKSAIRVIRRK